MLRAPNLESRFGGAIFLVRSQRETVRRNRKRTAFPGRGGIAICVLAPNAPALFCTMQ